MLYEVITSEYNPITNSGHETCLWQYKDGMAAMLTTDGVEKNTVQYAEDGINFEIKAVIKGAPEAIGPYRDMENEPTSPVEGMRWGLCHNIYCKWGYITRFDMDDRITSYNVCYTKLLRELTSKGCS